MSCVKMRDENGKVIRDGLGRAKFFTNFHKVTSNPLKIAERIRAKRKQEAAEEAARTAAAEEKMRMRAEGGF
jgi:hypothetical protein